ncbi:MAG: hypothetical protein HC767_13755, partial [Akkermansiaceae bacterium]|nr:hypothetical protein [Akkermansiaceae bacterium]
REQLCLDSKTKGGILRIIIKRIELTLCLDSKTKGGILSASFGFLFQSITKIS